jgi:VWFA-related protein
MIRRAIAFAAVSLLCMTGLYPQQQQTKKPAQEPRPIFKVQSNLVVVDVTVRDKKGTPVRDLRKEDFTVYEDGVPQEIVTFALENIPTTDEAQPETPQPVAQPAREPLPSAPRPAIINFSAPGAERKKDELKDRRLIVMFFDLSSLTTEDLIRSVTTAQQFVTKKATSHDLIAIATYSSTLQLIQDLTNDRQVLTDALKHLDPTDAGNAVEDDLGDPDTSDDTFVPDDVQFNVFNTDRRLSAIETVAKSYREFPERKSLIYFSSGMKTTGIENQSQIRSTVDVANQSNMSIYTVDSRGLQALPPGGGASRGSAGGRAMFSGDAMSRQTDSLSSSQETLTTLAADTGGAAFQDTNDLAPVFAKVVADTQSYYIVGYYSANAKEDGKFRKVRVEVHRPDVKIQHRPGYFASKQFLRLTQSERERQLEEALNVDRPFSDLPFILEADYFKQEGPSCSVPVTLQLAGDGIQFEEKGNRREADLEFLARITDPKGKVAGVARDVVQVKLPVQTAEKIKTGQILYSTGFQLRPGEYTLKFLMRDNRTGKLGTFEQALAVPALDAKSLQTSSIVVGSRLLDAQENSAGVEHRTYDGRGRFEGPPGGYPGRGPGMGPGMGPGPGGPPGMYGDRRARDPLAYNGKKIVPSIGNVFLNRQTLYVYFQVYGAAEDTQKKKPSLETRLLFLHNKTKALESEAHVVEEWSRGVATVAMAVPLRSLKKGTYTLQVHVRDNVSDTNTYRRLPIVVN